MRISISMVALASLAACAGDDLSASTASADAAEVVSTGDEDARTVGTLRTRDRDIPLTVEALALPENALLREGTARIWAGTDDFDQPSFVADPHAPPSR